MREWRLFVHPESDFVYWKGWAWNIKKQAGYWVSNRQRQPKAVDASAMSLQDFTTSYDDWEEIAVPWEIDPDLRMDKGL